MIITTLTQKTQAKHTNPKDAALYYAERGFHVFPVHRKIAEGICSCNYPNCKSIGKHPRTEGGVNDATTDPKVINYWWNNAYPNSGVAIATGRKSGFFVVDVDVKEDGLRAWETFKDDHGLDDFTTPAQRTPSGGLHVMYTMPEEGKVTTRTNVLARGIDIRGDGGYIVVAPSNDYSFITDQSFDDCEFEEADQSILDLVIKKDFKADENFTSPVNGLFDMADIDIERIHDALGFVDCEDYSDWWEVGAALHSTSGKQAFQIWCEWSEQSSKYDHEHQVKTWHDFDERRGNTPSSINEQYLYSKATDLGWQETYDHSDVDIDPNITNEEFQQMRLQSECGNVNKIMAAMLSVRTVNPNLFNEKIAPRNWIIENYLLAGYINLLISPGAVGKSTLTLIEAISVATGKDLLKLGRVKKGNVLLINNEDDDSELDRRICAICQYYGISPKELEGKLFIKSGYSKAIKIADEHERVVTLTPEAQYITALIKDKNISLLVVDPFVSTHSSNENDNSQIDSVIQKFKAIAGTTGAAIRLVHHTRKSGGEVDAHAGDIEFARGASSLKDAARSCHTLSGLSEKLAKSYGIENHERHKYVRIDDAKNNFSLNANQERWYRKEGVNISNGEWIGVLSSCTLSLADTTTIDSPERKKARTIHAIAESAIAKLGYEGGKIKAIEILAEYMNLTNYKKSAAESHFTLLPLGNSKSERVNINGHFYRIFQTKEDKKTSPRFIHITLDE